MKLKAIKEQLGLKSEPNRVQVQEIDESSVDLGKFDALVRAGLANKAQIQRLHRILEKMHETENPNLNRADRMIVTNLFNKMVDLITSDPAIFQRAKRDVKEEVMVEEHNETKSLPVVLILKRKAIRLFPNGLKVATYYSDRLDRTFTLPMQDLGMMTIAKEEYTEDSKKK